MSPTGVFTRSNSGGVINVQGNGQKTNYPPAPIRDLVLTSQPENETFDIRQDILSFNLRDINLYSHTTNLHIQMNHKINKNSHLPPPE